MNSKEFGEYIRDLRKEKGLTLKTLGEKSGFTKSYLSIIENGKNPIPKPDTLKKLANGLGVSYIKLMNSAGHEDHKFYIDEIFDDGLTTTEEITTHIPIQFKVKDSNGVAFPKTAKSKEELETWLFDLNYLLNAKIDLYYKENKLTEQDKLKIKTLLNTILE